LCSVRFSRPPLSFEFSLPMSVIRFPYLNQTRYVSSFHGSYHFVLSPTPKVMFVDWKRLFQSSVELLTLHELFFRSAVMVLSASSAGSKLAAQLFFFAKVSFLSHPSPVIDTRNRATRHQALFFRTRWWNLRFLLKVSSGLLSLCLLHLSAQ